MKKLFDLISHINHISIYGDKDKIVSSVCYNSQKCINGSAFVAISGNEFDGHKFIESAIEKGAKTILCEKLPILLNDEITYIVCENTRISLAELSHAFYDFPANKLKIVGITGTNGKTTISFLLKSIFETAGLNCAIIGTTGVYYSDKFMPAVHTTPESLELAKLFNELLLNDIEYVFMEVSSHALSLHRAASINFIGAIFTNLSLDHLDFHNNMFEYASAKKILFESLSESAFCILNGDDDYAKFMTNGINCKNQYFVGKSTSNDFSICNQELNLNYSKFEISGRVNFEFTSKLLGSFNIENCALSAIFAFICGIDRNFIINGLESSDGAPGRMQKIILKNGAIGLVDYAHTPDALQKALNSCKSAITASAVENSKLICVFGCGGDRDKSKRPIMGHIASDIADFTIITSDNPRTENPTDIINNILEGVQTDSKYRIEVIADRANAIARAVQISAENDIILIAGKGHENYQIIGKEKFHFDDVEELGKYL